ncbi:hypothetical protein [Clostridium sp. YIM B02551]|uniref:hypothetical protein n=1 Tax=Clostridium sp. YIM B02551 TaxID=2910679 RepID=UPI001EEB9987|nr:hypothetical protein [Clostridium sp. YIM B02551]
MPTVNELLDIARIELENIFLNVDKLFIEAKLKEFSTYVNKSLNDKISIFKYKSSHLIDIKKEYEKLNNPHVSVAVQWYRNRGCDFELIIN